jgi:hypothetical protein
MFSWHFQEEIESEMWPWSKYVLGQAFACRTIGNLEAEGSGTGIELAHGSRAIYRMLLLKMQPYFWQAASLNCHFVPQQRIIFPGVRGLGRVVMLSSMEAWQARRRGAIPA